MPAVEGLLSTTAISGTIPIVRGIGPAKTAYFVTSTEPGAWAEAVQTQCSLWGGPAGPILPFLNNRLTKPWSSYITSADPDWVLPRTLEDNVLAARGSTKHLRYNTSMPVLVLSALAAMDKARSHYRDVEVPRVNAEDPWYTAYLAQFGSWSPELDGTLLLRDRLLPDTTYDMLIPTRYEPVVGSGDDFIERSTSPEHLSPVDVALIALRRPPVSRRWWARHATLPRPHARALEYGPDIVVVYTPGSLDDLCLLWALRAANSWPKGLPIGLPVHDAAKELDRWFSRPNALSSFATSIALVSISVNRESLEKLAGSHRALTVEEAVEFLRPPVWPSRTVADVAVFTDGRCEVPAWSPNDIDDFPQIALTKNLGTKVRVRPARRILPSLRSLTFANALAGFHFRDGAFETSSKSPNATVQVRWPTGWTVLEAYARDRGLTVAKSDAGVACESLLNQLGSIDALNILRSPNIEYLFTRLVEQEGTSYFRQKVREMTAAIRDLDDATLDDIVRVAAAPLVNAERDVTYETVRQRVGVGRSTKEWIAWCVERGVLVEGFRVDCRLCTIQFWLPVNELPQTITCIGCGNPIRNPLPPNQIKLRYRPSHTISRVFHKDAFSHLLACWWIKSLFYGPVNDPEDLIGLYPGVDFFEADGSKIGEGDVVALFADGTIAIGECKRNPVGLNIGEIEKLERLSSRVAAGWSFFAVPSLAETCGSIWRSSAQYDDEHPRFVFTAEHLYGDYPNWSSADVPVYWRDDSAALETRREQFSQKVLRLIELDLGRAEADRDIHRAWRSDDDDSE